VTLPSVILLGQWLVMVMVVCDMSRLVEGAAKTKHNRVVKMNPLNLIDMM
jgi:hypothetical protein